MISSTALTLFAGFLFWTSSAISEEPITAWWKPTVFEYRLIADPAEPDCEMMTLSGANGQTYAVRKQKLAETAVFAEKQEGGQGKPATWRVRLKQTEEVHQAFAEALSENIGGRLAILMDGDLVAAPLLRGEAYSFDGTSNFSFGPRYDEPTARAVVDELRDAARAYGQPEIGFNANLSLLLLGEEDGRYGHGLHVQLAVENKDNRPFQTELNYGPFNFSGFETLRPSGKPGTSISMRVLNESDGGWGKPVILSLKPRQKHVEDLLLAPGECFEDRPNPFLSASCQFPAVLPAPSRRLLLRHHLFWVRTKSDIVPVTPIFVPKLPEWGQAHEGFRVRIQSRRRTYELGETIQLHYELDNIGQVPFRVTGKFAFSINGGDPVCPSDSNFQGGSKRPKPGDDVRQSRFYLDMKKAGIDRPGKYKIELIKSDKPQENPRGRLFWHGELKSNAIETEVIPPIPKDSAMLNRERESREETLEFDASGNLKFRET